MCSIGLIRNLCRDFSAMQACTALFSSSDSLESGVYARAVKFLPAEFWLAQHISVYTHSFCTQALGFQLNPSQPWHCEVKSAFQSKINPKVLQKSIKQWAVVGYFAYMSNVLIYGASKYQTHFIPILIWLTSSVIVPRYVFLISLSSAKKMYMVMSEWELEIFCLSRTIFW